MAGAGVVRELAGSCPWDRPEFRAGLAALTGSAQSVARRWAADVRCWQVWSRWSRGGSTTGGTAGDIGTEEGQQAFLPDPDELDLLDRAQLEPPDPDGPPWLPDSERDRTTWTWLNDDDIAC